jgi:hypothetical protein
VFIGKEDGRSLREEEAAVTSRTDPGFPGTKAEWKTPGPSAEPVRSSVGEP